MRILADGKTLKVAEFKELGASNANQFRDRVRSALKEDFTDIDVDLSDAGFIDSCGLGALIALHKTVCSRKGVMRLLNPQPPVSQILKLTRMHRIFDIVKTSGGDSPKS